LKPTNPETTLLNNDRKLTPIEDVAALLNIEGFDTNQLMNLLIEEGVFMDDGNGNILPQQEYIDEGYFVIEEKRTSIEPLK
jgi:phage antirepressor YoqD-like protein